MTPIDELECYLTQLAEVLGHADRHAGFKDYCRGLLLPIARKSIEPIARSIARQLLRCPCCGRTRRQRVKKNFVTQSN